LYGEPAGSSNYSGNGSSGVSAITTSPGGTAGVGGSVTGGTAIPRQPDASRQTSKAGRRAGFFAGRGVVPPCDGLRQRRRAGMVPSRNGGGSTAAMLRSLYDKIIRLAGHPQAVWWLALIAFLESSVFPIPPDVMLVPLVLADRRRAFRYAAICTVASVIGGWVGYAIGYALFETLGVRIIAIYHLQAQFESFRQTFNDYGAWIVLIKGLTPIPYKLVTITAGATHLDLLTFSIASVISRGGRFFLVALLLWYFGDPIRHFIERYLTWVTTGFLAAVIGGFLILRFI